MYTGEEFAQKMKLMGLVRHIRDARKYVKQSGKTDFSEEDFEEAWRKLNAEPIGRSFIWEVMDGDVAYYKKCPYGEYWLDSVEQY